MALVFQLFHCSFGHCLLIYSCIYVYIHFLLILERKHCTIKLYFCTIFVLVSDFKKFELSQSNYKISVYLSLLKIKLSLHLWPIFSRLSAEHMYYKGAYVVFSNSFLTGSSDPRHTAVSQHWPARVLQTLPLWDTLLVPLVLLPKSIPLWVLNEQAPRSKVSSIKRWWTSLEKVKWYWWQLSHLWSLLWTILQSLL